MATSVELWAVITQSSARRSEIMQIAGTLLGNVAGRARLWAETTRSATWVRWDARRISKSKQTGLKYAVPVGDEARRELRTTPWYCIVHERCRVR